jgi:hypothetical protein
MTACCSCGGWSDGYQFTEDCGGMDVTGLRTGQGLPRRRVSATPRHQHPFLPPTLHALLHPYLRRPACPHIKLAVPSAMRNRSLPTCPAAAIHSRSTQNTSPNIYVQENRTPQSPALHSVLPSQLAHRNTSPANGPRGAFQSLFSP